MKQTISTPDKTKIKSVSVKYPDLFKEDIEDEIKSKYYYILSVEEDLNTARDRVRYLEDTLSRLKNEFSQISHLIDIEFETKTKEINLSKSSIMIKNYGNDILGKSNNL